MDKIYLLAVNRVGTDYYLAYYDKITKQMSWSEWSNDRSFRSKNINRYIEEKITYETIELLLKDFNTDRMNMYTIDSIETIPDSLEEIRKIYPELFI